MSTCDDQHMPKPATGKTPVRNARIPDEVWLPAIAKAEMEGRSASEAMTEALRRYAVEPAAPAYGFTLLNWPDAAAWAEDHGIALGHLHDDLAAALDSGGFTLPEQWLAVAAWLASTHHPTDPAQQKRVITGHILRRAMSGEDASWRARYRDSRHLSETVQAILDQNLPLKQD
jgi:hypothetical protein